MPKGDRLDIDPFSALIPATGTAAAGVAEPEGVDPFAALVPPKTTLQKAIGPVTSYPQAQREMAQEGLSMAGEGAQEAYEGALGLVQQWPNNTPADVGRTLMGAGKAALGAVGYGTSPVNAAYRTVVGQPGEDVTGIPKEYFEFAAALATPASAPAALANIATKARSAAAPTIGALKEAARRGYRSDEVAAVTIKPAALPTLSQKIQASLDGVGIDENVAPKTFGILGGKKFKVPEGEGVSVTVKNLESARKTFGRAAGSIDKTERMAAVTAKNEIDDFLSDLPEGALLTGDARAASATLAEARANYGAASRAELLDRKALRAELRAAAAHSGQNLTNTMRSRIADVLLNPAERRGFAKSELAQMERIVRGTKFENGIRFTSKLLGGGGGIAAFITAVPTIGVAPVLGFGLTKAANAMTARNISKLNRAVRENSPLGEATRSSLKEWHDVASSGATSADKVKASVALASSLRSAGIEVDPSDLTGLDGSVNAGDESR